jgi:hypothetical protein
MQSKVFPPHADVKKSQGSPIGKIKWQKQL